MKQNIEENAELRLTLTMRRTYIRFIKTFFSVVLAQNSIRYYLRKNANYGDCPAIIANEAAVLDHHVAILSKSLIEGRDYVINNCGRLAAAGVV